jgi:hypothetical protein
MEAKFETWGTKSETSENIKTKEMKLKLISRFIPLLLHFSFYLNPRTKYTMHLRPNLVQMKKS